jgi:Ca2+-dependent lipid-binding protein
MSRLLEVRVLEARNVIACDRGGTSDPYVVLTLVDLAGREVKGEKQKTEKITKTLNPKWNATLVLGTCGDLAATTTSGCAAVHFFIDGWS